ncbi:hypothetical protein DPEC_G00272190 [Dallia pectoralis]|uniref:Uncharacterized protein n=1 Tax=Dallia pectoralis TaxID=75939 RepID=A0ACC2FPR8_DALPE|nr:hypothetical protein DPEC_G00272190 [Dallia pectoralis]
MNSALESLTHPGLDPPRGPFSRHSRSAFPGPSNTEATEFRKSPLVSRVTLKETRSTLLWVFSVSLAAGPPSHECQVRYRGPAARRTRGSVVPRRSRSPTDRGPHAA